MNNLKTITIVTIKWGTKYTHVDVNRLLHHIKCHSSYAIDFHCFTDNPMDLDRSITAHPLPDIQILPEHTQYAYRKEAGLCDDNLGNLTGKRVFFFDLDVLISGNLDEVFDYPREDRFVIANDWNTKGDHVGQASFYSWVVGTLGFIKTNYEKNAHKIVGKFGTASQEYLSSMIIERDGLLHFWPTEWCVSFKSHCLPKWYRRYFKSPICPKNAKIICFHGDPKPENALIGKWSDTPVPFYKSLYKKNKPAPWLKDMIDF